MNAIVGYKKPRLGPRVWGLSGRWLAVCPWNGDESWIHLPLVGLIVGTKHVELMLGAGKWAVNIDVRWRWE